MVVNAVLREISNLLCVDDGNVGIFDILAVITCFEHIYRGLNIRGTAGKQFRNPQKFIRRVYHPGCQEFLMEPNKSLQSLSYDKKRRPESSVGMFAFQFDPTNMIYVF